MDTGDTPGTRLQPLRPYQQEVARAIMESILGHLGRTFTVEIARQGGKNELSAQVELLLLALFIDEPRNLVKCSPSFKPQLLISMDRLKDRLHQAGFSGKWAAEQGYIIRLGNARAIFLSADRSARVVGHTAHLLLEIDESQDVSTDKYTKEFKPMGAATNVTTVHYGTTWDDSTLLEEVKQANLELERKDGIRRHFRYDWQEVAKYNPDYAAYVEGERLRLGDSHPLFVTQYCLLPVHGGGGFLSAQQRAQLQGSHPRLHHPARRGEGEAGRDARGPARAYVAGIDLAGEAEETEGWQLRQTKPRQDSTVLTIGEVDMQGPPAVPGTEGAHQPAPEGPAVKIVEHYAWTGRRHTELYPQLVDILKNVWKCRQIVVDATGVGQPVASFLREALGSSVTPFVFTQPSKSSLGFDLLAAVNSGRLKMYAGDGSEEYRQFWREMELARSHYRASRTMDFYVEPRRGHDDYLMSLALLVQAAGRHRPRIARGSLPVEF